jgi:Regulator of chromosome condensation (RCC1) repeat
LHQIEGLKEIDTCQVAAGQSHALTLSSDRRSVYAWGRNDCGQTGLGTTRAYIDVPTQVQFGDGPGPLCIADIAAGERHSMAKTEEGGLYSWGDNVFRQTGHITDEEIIPAPRKVELKVQGVDEPLTVIQMVGGANETLFLVRPPSVNVEALNSAIEAAQNEAADVDMDLDNDPFALEQELDLLGMEVNEEMRSGGWTRVSKECAKPVDACKDRYCQIVLRRQADPQVPLESNDDTSWTEEEEVKLEHVVLRTFQSIVDSNLERLTRALTTEDATAFYNDCKPCLTMRKTMHSSFVFSSLTEEGWICCHCSSRQSQNNNGLTCVSCNQDSVWLCLDCNKSQMDSAICSDCKKPRPQVSSSATLSDSSIPSAGTGSDAVGSSIPASVPAASSSETSRTGLDSTASIQGVHPFNFRAPAPSSPSAGSASSPSHQGGRPMTVGVPHASAPLSFDARVPTTGPHQGGPTFTFGFAATASTPLPGDAGVPTTGPHQGGPTFTFGFAATASSPTTAAQPPAARSSASESQQLPPLVATAGASTPAGSGAGSTTALLSTPRRRRQGENQTVATRRSSRLLRRPESTETAMQPLALGNLTPSSSKRKASQVSSPSPTSATPSKKKKRKTTLH